MTETRDRCGPAVRAAYRASGAANLTCAGTARPSYGRRCARKAGPSGRWRRRPSCHLGPHRRRSHVNHLTRHADTAAGLHTSTLTLR
jgi:hypothetical protein